MNEIKITDNIRYVGVDDKTIDLFESQYVVPNGISYNSYVIQENVFMTQKEKFYIFTGIDRTLIGRDFLDKNYGPIGFRIGYVRTNPTSMAALNFLLENLEFKRNYKVNKQHACQKIIQERNA